MSPCSGSSSVTVETDAGTTPILNGVTPKFVAAFPNARLEADVSTGTIAESFRRVSSGDWDLGVVLAGVAEQHERQVRVELQHLAASPVGAEVVVTSDPSYADGRLQRFRVSGRHTDGKVVATGEITRVVVDVDRFLARFA